MGGPRGPRSACAPRPQTSAPGRVAHCGGSGGGWGSSKEAGALRRDRTDAVLGLPPTASGRLWIKGASPRSPSRPKRCLLKSEDSLH